MTVGSKEFYEELEMFEKIYAEYRLDKEDKSLWTKGLIYQDGMVNSYFKAFASGYSCGRVIYMQEIQ